MSQYPYENLTDEEFESLVIRIGKEVLGIGCKTFSVGKDGAKDSWFTGTADYFPSKRSPWTGTFNIQAKHTKSLNASCSDNDFSVNQTSVLSKEIARLKEVIKTTPFDNYIIFTNRKLSGGTHPIIVKMLQSGLGIQNVEIIGKEDLDSYLTDYPDIAYQFGLYKFQAPLRFYEKELRDVIVVFSEQSKAISTEAKNYITTFTVIDKEKKNDINNLSKDYFEFLKSHSLQYFEGIESFLRDPKNDTYLKMYSNTVSDLQDAITVERSRFNEFEHIIKHLIDYTIGNNEDKLMDLRKIVRVFIHFMYFNCDIGKTA
ncbi:ABC-three component system protein [Aquirufa aurantiipilula]